MRAPAALTAAFLLAGCISLDPTYHRPPQPTPAQFPTGPSYAPPPAQAVPIVGWRDFFADPRLKSVIEEALANNRDLRVAVANIAAARAQVGVERSNLFPHIGAQAQANYGQVPVSSFGGTGPGSIQEHQYSANLAVTAWQLDLFGRVQSLTRAAQNQYFASQRARDAAQIALVAEVATDYLTLAADRARLDIANQTVVSNEATATLVQRRFEDGIASGLDVSQTQTVLQQARFDAARLVTVVAKDRNALDLVVGAPVADDLLPAAPGPSVAVLSRLPAGLSSDVLLRRPDVLEAEDQLKAANANIGAARAAFFPTLSLTGSGGFSSAALSTLFTGPAAAWSFIPQITAPIFEGGLNRANLALAKAQRDAAVAAYEKTIQTAFREVADALADRGTIAAQLAAQSALTAATAQALLLANARYEHGADTYLNTLIAQRADYVARQSQVLTQLDEQVNLVVLYTALGGGL
jgi:outer membrane protein, multidrug efflux system